jgi:hypothetical protein
LARTQQRFANGSLSGAVIETPAPVRCFFAENSTDTGNFSAWPGTAAESATMNDETIFIGVREDWGQQAAFGIPLPDLRQHVYLIGKTGSGKTTLLRNALIQHIALGHGVGLVDPHGDLAEEILQHVPRNRTNHVVYFNPGDTEFPIALNLLANVPNDERPLVASGIVAAFKSIWRDSWGPRMEYILYNAIAALLDCQNTSLLGVNCLLTDDSYRSWVIRQIEDPFIRDFWQHEFASYEPRFQREAIAPIQNKLGQFLLNPVIRNILGQVKCKVSFPFMMNNERIFVANLSKGKIGNDKANLLGSLLVTQFQLAAMRRASEPEDQRRDFHLFIDEFQNFTTDAFSSMLAEARKYRLCLTLSHQYVEQLSPEIRHAVFGNAGTLLSFRIGYSDAEVLEKEFAHTFRAQQFVDLARFEVIARILEDGTNREPFKGKTLAPLESIRTSREHLAIRSREKFATPRANVEAKLNRMTRNAEMAISNFEPTRRKRQNRRSATTSSSPKPNSELEAKRTRQYRGAVLPI